MRPVRIAVCGVLAGLLHLGALPASALEGRYVVVRRDGTTTMLAAPPERKGSLLVGRLLEGGQLISFPAEELDEARTVAANAAAPTPAFKQKPGVLKKSELPVGETRKLAVPRSDAERALASSSGTASGQGALVRVATADEAIAPAAAVDRNGHGEAWWRKKATPLLLRTARAEADLTRARSARDSWQTSPGAGTPAWQMKLFRLDQAVSKAQGQLDDARRRQDALAEDARKAGAYPGWIR